MATIGKQFPADVLSTSWLATWAPYLTVNYHNPGNGVGSLLATVLDQRDSEAEEIFGILTESLNGQHEIGAPGRHIYSAFLLSARPEAWEAVEKTLLAAQRQEGLRQAILETIDFTHPEAFRRMLRLILEHDLYRFSAVVRAVDVWFGHLWAAGSGSVMKKMLGQLADFLDNPATCETALKGEDPEAAFLALWCAATEDAVASIPKTEELLKSKSVEMRYIAARHLYNLDLNVSTAALIPMLDDEDLRVALLAIPRGQYTAEPRGVGAADDRFERLERLVERVPVKRQKLKSIVWPWNEITVNQEQVAASLSSALGDRPPTRLIPHLNKMSTHMRHHVVNKLLSVKPWDAATREVAIELTGDSSPSVRILALTAFKDQTLIPAEVERLATLLKRKASDLRRGVLEVLLKQDDAGVLATSDRLLAAGDANQRLAGAELIRLMTDAQRSVDECRERADAYRASRKKVSSEELSHLDEISREKVAVASLHNALGLMNPTDRTPAVAPRALKVSFTTPAAVECLKSLYDLIHSKREETIRVERHSGVEEMLLGNLRWGFAHPDRKKSPDTQESKLPLAEIWKSWYSGRAAQLKDDDGLELVRAQLWADLCTGWEGQRWKVWSQASESRKKFAEVISGGQPEPTLRYPGVVKSVIQWLLYLFPRDSHDYLLDALEAAYSMVPADDMQQLLKSTKKVQRFPLVYQAATIEWRDEPVFRLWQNALSQPSRPASSLLQPRQNVRFWQLMHWREQPIDSAPRRRPDTALLRAAYSEGAASLADVADQLLGPPDQGSHSASRFGLLAELTERKPPKEIEAWLTKHPEVRDLVDRAVTRIVDLELSRGDAQTAATEPVNSLSALNGVEILRRILQVLGKAEFKVGPRWYRSENLDRRSSLTHLAQITFPAEGETPDQFMLLFKQAIADKQFPEERLLQLVFLAPQWLKCVENYFKWDGMNEGVYWFLAHMRWIGGLGELAAEAAGTDDQPAQAEPSTNDSTAPEEELSPTVRKQSAWERLILERTPLSGVERNEGAIDVPWFQKTYAQLGDKHWQRLAAAARFAANASQAKRAVFVADVLLNRVSRKELVDGIKKRQLKEYVRLLGLLPLAKGKKSKSDLLERCKVLREYRRYASQLSGLTKPAAMRSWEIGMRNMAQTAGYADPLRLEWAVGAEAVEDLVAGPVVVEKGGIAVTLALDETSKQVITIRKGDKELKSIPPAIKKDKKIAELTGVTELKRQAVGIRQSLEVAMCRGDHFSSEELREWSAHALVAPMLSRLVVIGEGIMGYPDKQGKVLRDYQGKLEPVKTGEQLRFTHPHDLL